MPANVPVLLEQLAATGWFVKHGEVALTAGLTFCLDKDPGAAEALVELIRARTNRSAEDLPCPSRWQAECRDDNSQRIDIAGWLGNTNSEAPLIFVEAKISAIFLPKQISTYVVSQMKALADGCRTCGALAVLVPVARVRAASAEVAADLSSLGYEDLDQAWLVDGRPAVTVTVISWDEALKAMMARADQSAACDLQQLLGACRALQGADVTALTAEDLAGGWKGRRDDLRLIIDRVTREATATVSLRPAPWQPNSHDGLEGGFRYIAPPPALPSMAVGIRLNSDSQPFWVRWHKRTADIGKVAKRLSQAGYTVQKHDDHLWLPLKLEPHDGAATNQIESLVAQVVDLYKTAVAWAEPA